MTKDRIHFIWGPGGVGKSHVAVRSLCQKEGRKLLITLDPSPRVFKLLGAERKRGLQDIEFFEHRFKIRATDATALFERLNALSPANETVRLYFNQLVDGLQRFRDYLALIELAEELLSEDYDHIIVDTPPFHEAMGLHEAIFTLKDFFEKSLIQIAMRSSLLNVGVKKVIDLAKLFVGANTIERTTAFLDWLHIHLERFKKASQSLETLVFDSNTRHTMILTPESSSSYVKNVENFFSKTKNLEFLFNRSVSSFELEALQESPFKVELESLRKAELNLSRLVEARFPHASISRLPLIRMGDDSLEEMRKFAHLSEV